MSNDIEITITSKDKTDFDTPAKGAKKYGDALGGVGDKADASEQKILGAKDTVDGLATIMQGPGEQGIAAYLQGWADLASGVANFVIPALMSLSKEMIKSAAQAVVNAGKHVASAARIVAAWVLMGVQAMANAARMAVAWIIAMGPIGLLIAAIAAVIAIVVLLWKKNDGFRNAIIGAWKAVQSGVTTAARAVIGWLQKNWPLLLAILTGPIGLAVLVIAKNWDKIKAGASGVKNGIVGTFNEVVGFIKGLPKRISSAASGMWNGITSSFKGAINSVISGWNRLSFSIPSVDTHIPGVGKVGGMTLNTPNIPYLARGGRIARGGRAVVGENGAEVVDLPTGSTVYPHGTNPGNTTTLILKSDGSKLMDLLIEILRKAIRDQGGDVQAVLGR